MTRFEGAGCTHVGGRSSNEDAYALESDLGFFAAADGLGGYAGGEIASRVALWSCVEFLRHNSRRRRRRSTIWPKDPQNIYSESERLLDQAINAAHQQVKLRQQGVHCRMGTTLAALLLRPGEAVVAHVGDSRVYCLRQGLLYQLTVDHSPGAIRREALRLVYGRADAGTNYFEEDCEEISATSHMLTQALGMRSRPRPDLQTITLGDCDTFLICSDGLYEALPSAQLAAALSLPNVQQACTTLIADACQAGAGDNVTAVVVKATVG